MTLQKTFTSVLAITVFSKTYWIEEYTVEEEGEDRVKMDRKYWKRNETFTRAVKTACTRLSELETQSRQPPDPGRHLGKARQGCAIIKNFYEFNLSLLETCIGP